MNISFFSRLGIGLFAVVASLAASAAPAPTYAISGVVALGAPDRWDYLHYDTQARRLYVSHGDRVSVVDGVTGKRLGEIADLPGSHGTIVAPGLKKGVADSATNKTVTVFDPATLKPLGTAPAGDDADGIAYDAGTKRAFVANGNAGTVTAIDVATGQSAGTVTLGSKPEFLVADGAGHLYVNGESTREVLRVDAKSLAVTARYPVPDCESPHGIAMDAATQRIFTSCVNGKLFVLDATSGKIVATIAIGRGSDAVAFDPRHSLAFSSNGEGTLSVIAEKTPDDFELVGNVPTLRGARTMAVDPANGRVFLVTAEIDHVDPPKTAGGRARAVFKPGSLKVYFFDPVH